MNSRRSFFSRIAGAVATIALAPEIAFRAKLDVPKLKAFWVETECYARCYDEGYLEAMRLLHSNGNGHYYLMAPPNGQSYAFPIDS